MEVLPDGELAGLAVHHAARVMAAAPDGQIATSSLVRDLAVGSDLSFHPIGSHELKGIPGPQELFLASDSPGAAGAHGSSVSTPSLLQRALLAGGRRAPTLSLRLIGRRLPEVT